MTNARRWLKSWLPLLIWMALIFSASTDHGSAVNTSRFITPLLHWLLPKASEATIDRAHFAIRKSAHISEYAILGILAFRAITSTAADSVWDRRWKFASLALALAALYAASDEFHQSFVPSRGASAEDVLIDTCGALIGIALFVVWRMQPDKKESST